MARHEMGTIQAGIVQRRDHGLARHGEFTGSREGLQILADRWAMVQTEVDNNVQTDTSHGLTVRMLEMGGLVVKFLEQYGVKPLPTILNAKLVQPTLDTDPVK